MVPLKRLHSARRASAGPHPTPAQGGVGRGGALQRASCPRWGWFGPCELSDGVVPWMRAVVPGRERPSPCFCSSDRCSSTPQNTASGFRGESEFRSGVGAALPLQASSYILPLQTFPMSCISHLPYPASPGSSPFCISRPPLPHSAPPAPHPNISCLYSPYISYTMLQIFTFVVCLGTEMVSRGSLDEF